MYWILNQVWAVGVNMAVSYFCNYQAGILQVDKGSKAESRVREAGEKPLVSQAADKLAGKSEFPSIRCLKHHLTVEEYSQHKPPGLQRARSSCFSESNSYAREMLGIEQSHGFIYSRSYGSCSS